MTQFLHWCFIVKLVEPFNWDLNFCLLVTSRQQSCGKVIFPDVSISHSDHRGGTHDVLDLTVQPPRTELHTQPYPAGDIWWPRIETYSNVFT